LLFQAAKKRRTVSINRIRCTVTEEELISGCIRKEAKCQKQLFDLYAGRLFGVCLRYARNRGDAEDILQDAFIKIFDKISQFKREGSFEGWMKRIAVNTALKKYSVSRYRQEVTDSDKIGRLEISLDETVYSHLGEKELLKMIQDLPEGYRLVFNLYVMEGYQHNEIAEMLNIQAGTSRSQLVKARMMLQKQILEIQKQNCNEII